MDGSSASLIAIPIVVIVVLAAWLILVAYAASHPQWKHGTQAAGPGHPAPSDGQLRTAEPRPAAQARTSADHDAAPEQHIKLAARTGSPRSEPAPAYPAQLRRTCLRPDQPTSVGPCGSLMRALCDSCGESALSAWVTCAAGPGG